jgi:parallel beta-helix repeat protein
VPSQPEEPDPDIEGPFVVELGMDLAALVANADKGDIFMLMPGVHRGPTVEPKDGMSFLGEPGAIMSGAEVLSGFSTVGDVWVLAGVETQGRNHGVCVDDYDGCALSQDLFMDDVMLWQVTKRDDLKAGTWYRDGDVVHVADDPTNRRIEISVTPYAFIGTADDVEIRGIAVEKYATPAQEGAIQSQAQADGAMGTNWLIADVEISGSHGAGIRAGDHTIIRGVYVHDNGQLGVTAAGSTNLLVEDSEIVHNNIAGFRWEWEAGGVKVTNSTDVVFNGNTVRDNDGPGLWADLDTVNTLYEDNVVVSNSGPGVFHEISGRAVVRRNTVEKNGFGKTSWLWGAGILVAASSDVEVYDNILAGNANGIAGVQQDRGEGPYGPRLLAGLSVHDNTMDLGDGRVGIVEDVGDTAVFDELGNRFERNTYVGASGRRYVWENRRMDRSGWVAQGQDIDGTWR